MVQLCGKGDRGGQPGPAGSRYSDASHEAGEARVIPQRVIPLLDLQQNQHTVPPIVGLLKTSHRLIDFAQPRVDPSLEQWALTKGCSGRWTGDATIIGNCENGGLSFVESGTGHIEHMGKTTWSNQYCMDPLTWTGSGTATETAANGDKIFVQTTPHFIWTSPTGGTWIEEETVTGGTGRFAGATGSSHSKGTFTLTSPTTATWEGTTIGTLWY